VGAGSSDPLITITQASTDVTEGGSFGVTLQRTGDLSGGLVFEFVIDDGGYLAGFGPGAEFAAMNWTARDDGQVGSVYESDGTINFSLVDRSNDYDLGQVTSVSIQLHDSGLLLF
jgi:hypothetical protein